MSPQKSSVNNKRQFARTTASIHTGTETAIFTHASHMCCYIITQGSLTRNIQTIKPSRQRNIVYILYRSFRGKDILTAATAGASIIFINGAGLDVTSSKSHTMFSWKAAIKPHIKNQQNANGWFLVHAHCMHLHTEIQLSKLSHW